MKVKYRKDKTIITLNTEEERQEIFDALRFFEKNHEHPFLGTKDNVGKLLDRWMEEAETIKE